MLFMQSMTRANSESDAICSIAGKTSLPISEASSRLPTEFQIRPGETASEYRERIAPQIMQHLVAKAVIDGDSQAMGAFIRLHEVDLQAQIRLEELTGGRGKKIRSITGPVGAMRRAMGLPAGQLIDGVAAGTARASDLPGAQ